MTPIELCAAIALAASLNAPLPDERVAVACDNAEHVIEYAEDHDVDPVLLASLIYVESRWNPKAQSWADACGLTQVVHRYADESCEDLKDPQTSIRVGAEKLRKWIDVAGGDVRGGLACYNAGYVCLKSSEAAGYARKVLRICEEIRRHLECHDLRGA